MDCLCVAHNKSYSRQSWPSVCLLSLHSTYLVVSNYPRLLVFILCEYMMLVMKLWCWHVAVLFGALLGKRLTNIYDTHVLVLCTHTHTLTSRCVHIESTHNSGSISNLSVGPTGTRWACMCAFYLRGKSKSIILLLIFVQLEQFVAPLSSRRSGITTIWDTVLLHCFYNHFIIAVTISIALPCTI